jgi:hypothetical protein
MSKAAELAALIGSQTALSNRNLIVNGAMTVAQRGTSSTGVGSANGYFTVDRFQVFTGSTAGRATMSQVADGPDGFSNSLKFECTTADTTIAAGENFGIIQILEGQDLQHLKKGTSSAESLTLSFYVKGNASATYTVEMKDNDNDRINTQTFDVTTSWNKVSLTFVPDTTGPLDDDNAGSFQFGIWLHAGSDFTDGTFASNTWAARTNGNRVYSSATSFFDSTSRTFYITGVQLEVGETATPFEHRSFGDELARCQRYFCKSYNYDIAPGASGSVNNLKGAAAVSGGTSTANRPFWSAGQYPVIMRSEPTIVLYHYDGTSGKITGSAFATYDGSAVNIGDRGFNIHPTGNVSNSDDEDHYAIFTASAEL